MKREIMIAVISILAEAGAGFTAFALFVLRTSGDYLTGSVLSGAAAFIAGVLVYAALDDNLKGKKKSPRAATRKAQ